jgi:hypothetical protein
MTSLARHLAALAFAATCWPHATCSAHAGSRVPPAVRVLLDRQFKERTVEIVGLDTRAITYVDAGGLIRTEPLTEFIALLPADGTPDPQPPRQGLWLTDGQRLPGDLRPGSAEGDMVRWMHPTFGPIDVRLDAVARARLLRPGEPSANPTTPAPTDRDTVTLVNGDRLSGFVESIGDAVTVDVDGVTRQTPRDRVAEIVLATPPIRSSGFVLWLTDGSIVAVGSMRTDRTGALELRPRLVEAPGDGSEASRVMTHPSASELTIADVTAALFQAGTIIPLAAIEPVEQRAVGGRDWTPPIEAAATDAAVLWAPNLILPGPMIVEWELPPGVTRLSCTAELPADMWAWGDCELVVSVGAGTPAEVVRERLFADRPRVAMNVALPGSGSRRLRLTLDPGRFGPIQDRVVIHRPILMLTVP